VRQRLKTCVGNIRLNIVLVDDNPVNLALLGELVKQLDAGQAHAFSDADAALQWCLQQDPDLVIVDYMMPGLNGLEFIKRLRAEPSRADVPLLMVTANAEVQVRYDALQSGANDFLTKPLDPVEFLARSRNMLALRRGQLALAMRASWLAEEVRRATQEIVERERDTIFRLSRAAEYRDPDTGSHVMRMAHYSKLIARRLGLTSDDQDILYRAAPMHDIGKVGIPDQVLLKPGRLDQPELAVMRDHARIGHEILQGSPSPVLQQAAVVALSHHEKFDGSGYPHGLVGKKIPLQGRIVAVADVFDALTTERPYKRPWSLEKARGYLEESSGSHFDPDCVDAFLGAWDEVLAIHERFQPVAQV